MNKSQKESLEEKEDQQHTYKLNELDVWFEKKLYEPVDLFMHLVRLDALCLLSIPQAELQWRMTISRNHQAITIEAVHYDAIQNKPGYKFQIREHDYSFEQTVPVVIDFDLFQRLKHVILIKRMQWITPKKIKVDMKTLHMEVLRTCFQTDGVNAYYDYFPMLFSTFQATPDCLFDVNSSRTQVSNTFKPGATMYYVFMEKSGTENIHFFVENHNISPQYPVRYMYVTSCDSKLLETKYPEFMSSAYDDDVQIACMLQSDKISVAQGFLFRAYVSCNQNKQKAAIADGA